MTASKITVSNGEEFYRIPTSDLDEARQDGFYVPAEEGRTIVSDGGELFEVPLADVAEAERDGFRDLLVSERIPAETVATNEESTTRFPGITPVDPASETEWNPVEPAEDLEEGEVANGNRRQLMRVFGFSSALHVAVVLILLSIIIPMKMEDRVEILSVLPNVDQEMAEFEEVVLQPERITEDMASEVIQDLITDTDKVIEIDINDLEISSVLPEKTQGAGNPVAK
ncbi:MAG: hypothetical protein VB861_19515, partial [Planctomycetaceae bacterium]